MKARKTEGWPSKRPCAWAPRTGPRGCLGLHPRIHDARVGAPFAGRPPLGAAPPLLVRVLYLLQLEFCFTSSFSYTRTRTNTCCPLWFKTPPSSDIKIARLRFLFVFRLRTGIDLRDQADLVPARSVTIGSWFSDCIGTSSLARRSRIMRVASHQIEVSSTHRKIGHFASIKIAFLALPDWILALHIVPRIRYLGFTTQGKKGPLTTTGDLSACKSIWTLIR
jgi:hypothetical protein